MKPGEGTKTEGPKRKSFNINISSSKAAEDELLGLEVNNNSGGENKPVERIQENSLTNSQSKNSTSETPHVNQMPPRERSTRFEQEQVKTRKPPGRKNKTEPWIHKNFNISERHAKLLVDIIVHARRNDDTNYNERKAVEAGIELLAKVRNIDIPPVVVLPRVD